jgi:flagellar basal body-associated protein FliL
MDLFSIIAIIFLLVVIFVATQVVALFFFLRENERLREENEKFQPPF